MAKDLKYGNVTMEHGSVGEDEPVFTFRAQDILLPKVLEFYLGLALAAGSPAHHCDAICASQEAVEKWQKEHADQVRVPNSNEYIERITKEI